MDFIVSTKIREPFCPLNLCPWSTQANEAELTAPNAGSWSGYGREEICGVAAGRVRTMSRATANSRDRFLERLCSGRRVEAFPVVRRFGLVSSLMYRHARLERHSRLAGIVEAITTNQDLVNSGSGLTSSRLQVRAWL